jgi:hypothetical protein
MSDSRVATFFKKPIRDLTKDGSVCGRFYQDQLDRNIEIPKKRIPWVKYFFQFALPAFLVSMKATAQGKVRAIVMANKIPVSSCAKIMGDVESTGRKTLTGDTIFTPVSDLIGINGKVIDENDNPLPYASIIMKGTTIGVSADSNGKFEMRSLPAKERAVLVVSSVGFKEKEVEINKDFNFRQDLEIQLTSQVMEEVIVTGSPATGERMVLGGAISVLTVRKQSNILIAKSPVEIPSMIKVYPNPVISGTSINIGCQKLKEGYYAIQLSNQSGQQVLNKQTWIDGETQVLNIDFPTVAAGIYFLKLTNKETNKRFTQKIIVQ